MRFRDDTKFRVPYRLFSFPSSIGSSPGYLEFSPADLVHALFVTGRVPGDRRSHGLASLYEWRHRTSLAQAYVRRNYCARLVRSSLAETLDRSESMALSYALGQAITGIFCEKILSVDFLMHVDRYASTYNVSFGSTRRRADLFGHAPSGWVVAEAKGRKRGMEPALRTKLVDQKRSVVSIGGQDPWLALGCVAHFPPRGGGMWVDAFDPEEPEDDPVYLDHVSVDRLTLAYYLPYLRLLEAVQQVDRPLRGGYLSVDFADIGARISLPNDLVRAVERAEESGEVSGLYGQTRRILLAMDDSGFGGFADGVIIETNWGDSISIQDWEAVEDDFGLY